MLAHRPLVALWCALVLAGCGESSPGSESANPLADRVTACERTHDMNGAHVKISLPPTLTFAACDWPPPKWADPDGYAAIVVTTTQGPGAYEATGTDYADRIVAPCQNVTLGYLFGSQGGHAADPPIIVRAGDIVTMEGKPYSGPLPFSPGRQERIVLHNAKNGLDTAECGR